ncbi:MAG: DUF72 domain-containing protein [Gammaproteobacteria bacterium]|nr:DUF72 domain-containing protein [Gammaproteobacteria bacterium]NIR84033.1 DUF72 domain-containing protein [Gammaproteobacteria bacterium]NIR89177.1 DUF72 domain-containing protein [Gammaproteobacteria bacterium]NIU04979.1 DUF72 domain-containing protein [Gammaproteobacteria bacterium]NIV52145.1 DUF72 domain-containing protein [Gammaproteobacteria bacterium]
MRILVGTSGFSYAEWKGAFYPKELPATKMLSHYAQRLPAVEINNTFYRLPKRSVLEGWATQVPEGFRFALKASRRITHTKRLVDAESETEYLLRTARALGPKLGVILFQLPPYLRKDLPRLERFLGLLTDDVPASFEFRHPSWFDEDVFTALHDHDCALCTADTDEQAAAVRATAGWGYVRLRRSAYSDAELRGWAHRLHAQTWDRAYVFFKHEDEAAGPRLAARLSELIGTAAVRA